MGIGKLPPLYIQKTMLLPLYFAKKQSFQEYFGSGPRLLIDTWKINTSDNSKCCIIYTVFIWASFWTGRNDYTCRKRTHMGVMDRGFTVPIKISLFVYLYTCNKLRTTQWIFIKFNVAELDTLNPSGDYL
jgi:hypothetical protein